MIKQVVYISIIIGIMSFEKISAQQPIPSRCQTNPEYRQFDFWIGEWEVKNPDEEVVGDSKIELTVGDCVIFETWTSTTGYTGKSLNYYSIIDQKWHQKWIGSGGIPIEFSGTYDPEKKSMNYIAKGIGKGGINLDYKLTFYHLTDSYARQHWEQSSDGMITWITIFDGHYRKKSTSD